MVGIEVGTPLGTSGPKQITMEMVRVHSATTGDAQWIHDDPERCARESPWGAPIVQGFLLLANLTELSAGLSLSGLGPASMMVNVGFDRVRFVRPVLVGASISLTAHVGDIEIRPDGSTMVTLACRIDPDDDVDRPAVVADWKFLVLPS